MKFVTEYGSVYKLTTRNWKKFVEHRARGGVWSVGHFGTALGPVTDVTEWTAEDATQARLALSGLQAVTS